MHVSLQLGAELLACVVCASSALVDAASFPNSCAPLHPTSTRRAGMNDVENSHQCLLNFTGWYRVRKSEQQV